jgi:hypothetical protein
VIAAKKPPTDEKGNGNCEGSGERNWERQEAGSRNCKEAGFRVQGSGTARRVAVIPAFAGMTLDGVPVPASCFLLPVFLQFLSPEP